MRILSEQDVERLIEPEAAIAAMIDGYRRHSGGRMPAPGRLNMGSDNPKGSVLVLAGHSEGNAFALKANMHVYPEPGSRHRKAASMMLLWDAEQCIPTALIATTLFNNHRTAAGLAAAAQELAPAGAKTLAVFGAGKIAPAVLRYLSLIRPFEKFLIVGKGGQRSATLAQEVREWPSFAEKDVSAITDAGAAARQADVIVTVTTSDTPVFPGRDIKPGSLVVLAGANRPLAREADDDLIARSEIYVDHLDSCVERAGDICIPLKSGLLKRDRIVGEIGSLFSGSIRRRPNGGDVRVFKSMGIIAQDIALAEMILADATRDGIGFEFDITTGESRSSNVLDRLISAQTATSP